MFVKALVDLYERLAAAGIVPKDGYTEVKISGKIILNDDGDIVDIEFRGKKDPVERLLVPYQPTRSNGKKPYFLCDNPKYMLGISEDPEYFPVQGHCIWKSWNASNARQGRFFIGFSRRIKMDVRFQINLRMTKT